MRSFSKQNVSKGEAAISVYKHKIKQGSTNSKQNSFFG
jgi:hypothetical protein